MLIKPMRYFAKDGDSGGAAPQPNQTDPGQGGANTQADDNGKTTPETSAEKTSDGPPDWFMAKLDDPAEAWKVVVDTRSESETWRRKYGDLARERGGQASEREPEPQPIATPEPEPQTSTSTSEIDRLKAELDRERKQRELDALKLQIGEEVGLSVTLAMRLTGDSADAIRQDAEQVLKAVKPQSADATGRRRTTQTPGGSPTGETDADRRARLFGGNTGRRVFTNRGN